MTFIVVLVIAISSAFAIGYGVSSGVWKRAVAKIEKEKVETFQCGACGATTSTKRKN